MLDGVPSWVFSGLFGGLAATLLGLLPRRARRDADGWNAITPSLLHWISLIGCAGFVAVLVFAATRPPSDSDCTCVRDQNDVYALYGLLVFFTSGTVLTAWAIRQIRKANVEWLGGQIRFSGPGGEARFSLLTLVEQIRPTMLGYLVITFVDGTELKLDQHAKGLGDLCRAIVEANGCDDDPDDGGEPLFSSASGPSVGEGIAHQNRVVALGAGRN